MKKMKKMFVAMALCLFVTGTCFAEIGGTRFSLADPEVFSIHLLVDESCMKYVDCSTIDQSGLYVNKAFDVENDGMKAQVRYTLLQDNKEFDPAELDRTNYEDPELHPDYMDAITDIANMMTMVAYNTYGTTDITIIEYAPEFCNEIYDADNVYCTDIINVKSNKGFFKGFKYARTDFIYKRGKGMIVRNWLSNSKNSLSERKVGGSSTPYVHFIGYYSFHD